jgi:hypothetical protein
VLGHQERARRLSAGFLLSTPSQEGGSAVPVELELAEVSQPAGGARGAMQKFSVR